MSWTSSTLGELINLNYGKGLPEIKRVEGDVPVYGSGGIIGFHKEALIEGPGIIVGRKGTVGSVFWEDEKFFPIDTSYYVTSKPEESNLKFIYYLLKSLPLASLNTDAAVPGLNRDNALRLKIKVPSKPIQDRIAEILSAYDSLIENNRRRIQLLEQSARLLYREWFVHLRFPGHEHVRIIDGVPEGWRKKKLQEIADINAISLNNGFQEKIEYIDISSVTTGQINETTLYEFKDAPGRARRLVRHGDIIWSCVRPNRESHAIIWNPQKNLIASTGFAVISPIEAPTSYIYQALTTKEFVGYLTNNARGVAYPAVTGKDFESADILIPTNSLLEQFDGIVS